MKERKQAIVITFPARCFQEFGSIREFLKNWQNVASSDSTWYWKMSNVPQQEVLYCYIVIGNRVRWRCNITSFESGGEMTFDGGRTVTTRNWRLLTAPVEKAPFKIPMGGFQGFRYSDLLW
jgi:hypothetical protein